MEKSAPGLRPRLAVPELVLADAGFADVDAQLEQLTMDRGRAPERVLAAQAPDQIANLTGKAGPTGLQAAYFLRPEEAKALAMPSNHSLRFDDGQCRAPVAPDSAQNHPQEPVDGFQARTFLRGTLQDTNLVSQCEDLQFQGRSRSKHGSHSSERRPNQEHQERHYGEATNSHHLKQIGVYDRHT